MSSLEPIDTDPTLASSTSALQSNSTSRPTVTKISNKKRKFLRRKTQSETWSHTAVSTNGGDSVHNNTLAEMTISTYKPVKLSSADNAAPSSSTLRDIQRVISLIEDERHLVAHELYLNVKERLDDWHKKATASDGSDTRKGMKTEEGKNTAGRWKRSWRRQEHVHVDDRAVDVEENEEAYGFYLGRLKEFEALEVSKY
jgi:hypothetical protein